MAPTTGFAGNDDELFDVLRRFEDIGTDEVHLIPTSSNIDELRRVIDVAPASPAPSRRARRVRTRSAVAGRSGAGRRTARPGSAAASCCSGRRWVLAPASALRPNQPGCGKSPVAGLAQRARERRTSRHRPERAGGARVTSHGTAAACAVGDRPPAAACHRAAATALGSA
jgi:hypothetical protein